MTQLTPLVTNNESLRTGAETAVANLEDSRAAERYAIDFDTLADAAFDGDVAKAERAYGLFSAYCARCHTAGYSAGPVATLEPGSGALGPSLRMVAPSSSSPTPKTSTSSSSTARSTARPTG